MKIIYENLTIRNATIEDAHLLEKWWNDGSIMAHAGYPNGTGEQASDIAAKIAQDLDYVHRRLILLIDNTPVGEMNYRNCKDNSAELGIKICDSNYQNHGYGKMFLSLVINELFEMGFDKIILDTNTKNLRAQHVYTQLGFTCLGIMFPTWHDTNGIPQQSINYELTPENFINFTNTSLINNENIEDYPVYNTMMKRRSVRKFLNKAVEHNKITVLLKAGMSAPSACNLQPWCFVVIDNPATLNEIKNISEQGRYNAPLIIAVCGISKHIPWQGESWQFDCGMATQNILLACNELGLGSVCVGGFDKTKLKSILDIPDDIHPVCLIEIGYPEKEPQPCTWFTNQAVHWQKFNNKKPRTLRTIEMLLDDIKAGKMS